MLPLRDNIPTRRLPIVTIALIVANVAMYFLFQRAGLLAGPDPENAFVYGAIPYELSNFGEQCEQVSPDEARCGTGGGSQPGVLTTVLTSMFMHGGLLHLGGNMLFLWIFGNNVEDSMGRIRFLLFYLLGGAVAFLAQTLAAPDAVVPTVGASGAVAAILGGYALLYPRARVVTLVIIIFFITLIELPAVLVLGFWFLLQLLNGTAEQVGQGGVAYFAHIGGFVFGLVLIKIFANRFNPDYDEPSRLPVY